MHEHPVHHENCLERQQVVNLVGVITAASGNDRLVRLYADEALVQSGLMKHILPRFSLKTQVRVELVSADVQHDLTLGESGRALFQGVGGL